jgi:cysteine desulfurase
MMRNAHLGNPSGHYAERAKKALQESKDSLFDLLSLDPSSYTVIWNSGASEGNNHVLRGFAEFCAQSNEKPHFILSAIEHHTSLACAKYLESRDLITLTLAKPNSEGVYDPVTLNNLITPNTRLVSIMHTNNEICAVNPIEEICNAIKLNRKDIFIHVDCVQSFGKEILPMAQWKCDAITVSFHKIGGPQGLGALIIRNDFAKKLVPLVFGTQSNGLRGGTENTCAISAIPETLAITFKNREVKTARLLEFKNSIVDALAEFYKVGNYSDYYGKPDNYVPSQSEIVFLGPTNPGNFLPDNERSSPTTISLVCVKNSLHNHFCNLKLRKYLLDRNIVISTGSACATDATYLNHVLEDIMAPFIIRCGVVRISLGDRTTSQDVSKLIKHLINGIDLQMSAL